MATIPQIRTRLLEVFPERQADVLAHVVVESHDDLATQADLHKLTGVVSDLANVVTDLAESQKELAEAQKRTEDRVEELAEAQKRTEDRVEELTAAQTEATGSAGLPRRNGIRYLVRHRYILACILPSQTDCQPRDPRLRLAREGDWATGRLGLGRSAK